MNYFLPQTTNKLALEVTKNKYQQKQSTEMFGTYTLTIVDSAFILECIITQYPSLSILASIQICS